MPGNNYNCSPGTPRSRLERLLRERELRKSNRYNQAFDEERDGNTEAELCCTESFASENEIWPAASEEEDLESVASARFFSERCQWQDDRPSKQRLLVVANRLPLSAVRHGVDSWQLDISVGGLVSALLGKLKIVILHDLSYYCSIISCIFYICWLHD